MSMTRTLIATFAATAAALLPVFTVDGETLAQADSSRAFAATHITLPKTRQAPEIDGVLADGEWDDAAAMTGLISQSGKAAHPRQAVFWMKHDDAHIYVAMRSSVFPEEENPAAPRTWFNYDSSLVVGLAPGRIGRGTTPSHYLLRANIDGQMRAREVFWTIEGGGFLPYWSPDVADALTTGSPEVYASAWRQDNALKVVVYNRNDEQLDVDCRLELSVLGIDIANAFTVVELEPNVAPEHRGEGELEFVFQNGILTTTVTLLGRNYRLFRIEQE